MPAMRDLSRWIRDYGHDPRYLQRLMADQFVWHQLWAALDIIDDVDSALSAYLDGEFPTDTGERYLRVYGVMQGLLLQQDALRDVIKAIHPTKKIEPNDVLKDIREARHASVGHASRLERKGGALSTHGIVQVTMNKEGFDLLSYPEKPGGPFWHVPVLELIDKQRAETVRILSEVVNELREREEAHRSQFREVKLMTAFSQVSYSFEKIFSAVRHDAGPDVSSWAVDHLQKSLEDFEKLLKERGLSVESYDSIKYLYDEIKHPLTELTKFVKREPSEVLSSESAVVFASALRSLFDELRHIADEIDEEYSSKPDPVVQPEAEPLASLDAAGAALWPLK